MLDRDVTGRPRRAVRLAFFIAGWLGALDSYLYATLVVQPHWDWAASLHGLVISDAAPSPYRYRVLVPFLAQGLSRFITVEQAYLLFYLAVFPVALCALLALLRRWYPTSQALIGVVLTAAVLPLSFRDHFFQPATWLEFVLVITALRLLDRPVVDLRWYAVVSVIAACNRETGILFGFLLVVVTWPVPAGRRLRTAVVAALPTVVYATIHLARGDAPPAEHNLLARNLADLPTVFTDVGLFLAIFAVLAIAGWRTAPAICRRAAWLLAPYLPLIATFGMWRQVRMLVPLVPIMLGFGLGALAHLDDDDTPRAPADLLRGARPDTADTYDHATVSTHRPAYSSTR